MDLIDLHDNTEELMDDFIRSRLGLDIHKMDNKDYLDFDHDKLDLMEDEPIFECEEKRY